MIISLFNYGSSALPHRGATMHSKKQKTLCLNTTYIVYNNKACQSEKRKKHILDLLCRYFVTICSKMQLHNNMKGSGERLNICKNIVLRKLEKKIGTNINALTFKSCTISLLKISYYLLAVYKYIPGYLFRTCLI